MTSNQGRERSPSRDRWSKSKKSRSQYARERREALVLELSVADVARINEGRAIWGSEPEPELPPGYGCCARCRRRLSPDLLEIDHVDGVRWDVHRASAWVRAARYWREHEQGVKLRALCRSCNATDGSRRRYGRTALP